MHVKVDVVIVLYVKKSLFKFSFCDDIFLLEVWFLIDLIEKLISLKLSRYTQDYRYIHIKTEAM